MYNEELLEAIINLAKFQLQHNIYAFHDARFRGANRPALGDGAFSMQALHLLAAA